MSLQPETRCKPVGGNVLAHASTYRIWLKKGARRKRVDGENR